MCEMTSRQTFQGRYCIFTLVTRAYKDSGRVQHMPHATIT